MHALRVPVTLLAALAAVTLTAGVVRAESLARIDASRVCMVNDTAFAREQIPVAVGEKTYFGCCEMCKGRLAEDASVREAVDPVSGAKVDKASAVIGVRPDGKVLYFESERTFRAFEPQS